MEKQLMIMTMIENTIMVSDMMKPSVSPPVMIFQCVKEEQVNREGLELEKIIMMLELLHGKHDMDMFTLILSALATLDLSQLLEETILDLAEAREQMDSPHLEETILDLAEAREQMDSPHLDETILDIMEARGQMDSPHSEETFLDLVEASNAHFKQKEKETRDIEIHVTPAPILSSLKTMHPNLL